MKIDELADALSITYGGSIDERRAYARGFMAYHTLQREAKQKGGGGIAELLPFYGGQAEAAVAKRAVEVPSVVAAKQVCPVCDHGYDGSEVPVSVVAEAGADVCAKCAAYMRAGIICVETNADGTLRTGRACVLRDESVSKLMAAAAFSEEMTKRIIAARLAYVPAPMYSQWVGEYHDGSEEARR